MKLFDDLINKMQDSLEGTPARYSYQAENAWPDAGQNELVMLRDAEYELGGGSLPTVNCTCVTTTSSIIQEDEILVYGQDLQEIHADVSFMRLALLHIEDPGDDDEQTYNAIKKLEFVRYNVHPCGYMVRVSSESNQEQVRVSKTAVSQGISFQAVGNDYISKYKEIPGVKHVRIIFVTGDSDLSTWIESAKKVDAITKTLTHILDGLPTDCGHCSLKPVCDEVEGLKEMHMKQRDELKNKQGGATNA